VANAYEMYSQSIYAMGNPHKLTDAECEDINLSVEIVKNIKFYQSSVKDDIDLSGLIRKLRKSAFNFDIRQYAVNQNDGLTRYAPDICKIIYFFFALQYNLIPELLNNIKEAEIEQDRKRQKATQAKTKEQIKKRKYFDVIQFLSEPSMESIDYSPLKLGSWGPKTYNGVIIQLIKETLEKEMSSQTIEKIKDTFRLIAPAWDEPIHYASYGMEIGIELDYEKMIRAFNSILDNPHEALSGNSYEGSAIETLYLKIKQYEYKGQLEDILIVNRHRQTVMDREELTELSEILGMTVRPVPSDFIPFMRLQYGQPLNICDIEQAVIEYIDEHAVEIAPLVYLKPFPGYEAEHKIRESTKKVIRALDFYLFAWPTVVTRKTITRLLIISCLQAILTDSAHEEFNYPNYALQYHTGRHYKPRVQAALKKDEYTISALKVYWVRKMTDHLYANIGRDELKAQLREFEIKRAEILLQIYSCPRLSDMLIAHKDYYEKIKPCLSAIAE
jgi:hypothetical protein